MLELRVHYLELIELSRWYYLFWVKTRMEWFDRACSYLVIAVW